MLQPLSTPRFLVLLFAVLTFAVHALSMQQPLWNWDEAFTAVTAGEILEGGVPYRDAVDHRAPLTSWIYAGILGLAGRHDMRTLHLVFAFVTMVTALLVAAIGDRLAGPGLAATSAFLFFFMSSFTYPPMDLLAFHTEWPLALLEAVGILLLLRAFDHPRPVTFVTAGLAFGLASLSKQPALLDLAAALLVLIVVTGSGRAAGLTAAAALLPWILTTGWFFAQGALDHFVFYVFTYNKDYYMAALPPGETLRQLVTSWSHLVDCAGIALLAALTVAAAAARATGLAFADLPVRPGPHALIAALAVSSFAAAVLPGRGFGHYFIQTFPSWSVAGALGLHILWTHFGDGGPRFRERRILIFLLIILPMGARIGELAHRRSREYRDALQGASSALQAVVAHVRARTAESDRIFVWGFLPDIYVLAGRRPGARFSYCTFVTGLVPWVNGLDPDTSRWVVPGSLDAMIADLEARRPALIVDTSPGGHLHWGKYPPEEFPAFARLLERDYVLEDAGPAANARFAVHRRRKP